VSVYVKYYYGLKQLFQSYHFPNARPWQLHLQLHLPADKIAKITGEIIQLILVLSCSLTWFFDSGHFPQHKNLYIKETGGASYPLSPLIVSWLQRNLSLLQSFFTRHIHLEVLGSNTVNFGLLHYYHRICYQGFIRSWFGGYLLGGPHDHIQQFFSVDVPSEITRFYGFVSSPSPDFLRSISSILEYISPMIQLLIGRSHH